LKPLQAQTVPDGQAPEPLEPMIRTAVAATARDNGWATLSAVGSMIMKNSPSFDPRNYGCQKLGELVRKQAYLEVKQVKAARVGDGPANFVLHVRLKAAKLPMDRKTSDKTCQESSVKR